MPISDTELDEFRQRFTCNFEQVDSVFADCINDACQRLSPTGVEAYLDGASLICMIGRGFEPVLVYLEDMPEVAERLGEGVLEKVSQAVWKMLAPRVLSFIPI